MEKFYCNNCEKDVDLINGQCPICKTNWEEIIEDATSDTRDVVEETSNSENDIQETFNFFLEVANTGKVLCFALAIIILFLSLMSFEQLGITLFVVILVISGIIALYGIVFEKSFKWKAYMLQTNYEILRKKIN